MLASLVALFLSIAQPAPPAKPEPEEWILQVAIETGGQRFVMRMPAEDYLECEDLRDAWLVDGPRDREGFRSEADCVPTNGPMP